MDRFDAMQVFARVAELASFTQAAESLGLSKGAVSGIVRKLEAELGTRLLHRTTRRVHLTPDGKTYYERVRDLLADFEDVQGLFRKQGGGLSGRLRVDLPLSVAAEIVLPRLPGFVARHPALEIELSSTDRRVDLVREGFDCVLRIGALNDSSLVARPLGAFRQISCASPAYLARHGTPRSLEALAGHRLIHYVQNLGGRGPGFEYRDPASGEARSLEMDGVLTVNNSEAYRAACVAGLGIAQAPEVGTRALRASGALVEILPELEVPALPVSLLYPNRRHLPRRVQAFMDWLGEVMAEWVG